jgi:hypothetical protein
VRYLTERFAVGALRRGLPIEQFLGPVMVEERRGVRWVTLDPVVVGIAVTEHAAEEVDREGFADLDNFPPLYLEEDRAWGWVVATAPDAESALQIAHELTGAVDDRWVNLGLAGQDYLDFVKAGRPSV